MIHPRRNLFTFCHSSLEAQLYNRFPGYQRHRLLHPQFVGKRSPSTRLLSEGCGVYSSDRKKEIKFYKHGKKIDLFPDSAPAIKATF